MQIISKQKGESLIALLIATSIFAIGISVIVLLQGAILKNTGATNQRVLAMNIARNTLETLRSFQATGALGFNSIQENSGVGITHGDDTKDGVTFTRSWNVTDYYVKPDEDDHKGEITIFINGDVVQKQVTITVGWGVDERVVLNTVICSC